MGGDEDVNDCASMTSDAETTHSLVNPTFGLIGDFNDTVTGIAVPEVESEGPGYKFVMRGWMIICCFTLFVQALIVVIMILYGVASGNDCIDEALPLGKWYMLHVSKAFATAIAGVLLGKELMDITNYWMVSMLLEAKTSKEVAVSAVSRILMIKGKGERRETSFAPVDVWVNMTALGFIGELSESVLDVAKKGVFGHNINKAVGSINFALNFMTDYPWWFNYVRGVTLMSAVCFVGFFAFLLFVLPDNVCLPDGSPAAAGLVSRIVLALQDAVHQIISIV